MPVCASPAPAVEKDADRPDLGGSVTEIEAWLKKMNRLRDQTRLMQGDNRWVKGLGKRQCGLVEADKHIERPSMCAKKLCGFYLLLPGLANAYDRGTDSV